MRNTVLALLLLGFFGCAGSASHPLNASGGASAESFSGASGEVGVAGIGGSGGYASNHAGAPGSGAGYASGGHAGGASTGGSGQGGASAGAAGVTAQAGAAGAATLAEVQAIFTDHCVLCHDKSKVGIPSYPALSLVAGDTRAALVDKPAFEECGGIYVVPGKPAQSYLIRKLSDSPPCDGVRMPRPYEIGMVPPLSAPQMATITSWISAGAQ